MAASIAHEIKQPLASVIVGCDASLRWLAKTPPNLEEVRECTKRISDAGHRASQVIDGIRAMFQKGGQERKLLDVNQLIREVLELVRGKAQKERVLVRSDLSDEMRPVQASHIQLQQVMLNLVMNAIDAMDTVTDGPRLLRVTSALRAPDDVLIAVEDSDLELLRKTSTASLIPSLRRNPMAWVWAWRFVDLLSRRTVGVFPHVQLLIEAQSLRLRCQLGIREAGFRHASHHAQVACCKASQRAALVGCGLWASTPHGVAPWLVYRLLLRAFSSPPVQYRAGQADGASGTGFQDHC